MKIIISPAKSLDFKTQLPTQKFSESRFLKHSESIQKVLKKKSPKELSELMSISDKLAELNYTRNQEWSVPFSAENARPAVYAFNGDDYTGLDAYTIANDKLDVLHQKLLFLTGSNIVLMTSEIHQFQRL